jgi:trehalose-6-phosphate hydrolase
MFEILKKDGLPEQEIIEILKQKSRDNSRTPVQWNASEHAGFTTGTPWIHTAANYKEINAENAMKDSDSVFYHYQELIRLRKEYDVITNGDYELVSEDHDTVFAFVRKTEHEMLLVINNFYGKDIAYSLPVALDIDGLTSSVLLSNYEDSAPLANEIQLRPYESIVYHLKK